MDKLRIRGGRRLHGTVPISGAKNAALPELCATLLTAEPVILRNVPRLQDVSTMLKLIRHMGVEIAQHADGSVSANAGTLTLPEAPYELVKTMRASVLALGPLLARFGHAKVSLPGGCAIGSRPVDQHLKGLAAMGADSVVEHGYMVARVGGGRTRLKGARITTDMVTVTGTENFLMAATLAEGETILENAAQEPEIPDLAEMLIAMGARVQAFDPEGMHEAAKLLDEVQFRDGPYEAVTGADVVVILTEWDQFRALDVERIKGLMRQPVMVDLRNVYRPEEMRARGFRYASIGRA